MKRAFDVVMSSVLLVLLLPVLLAVGLAVRLSLGSPVIFTQERPGRGGKPFRVFKFRTMKEAIGSKGEELSDERRLTRAGRFIRSTSLDELPQLVNVLKGDMSLVGPRPLLMEYRSLYSEEQRRRHEVRPGMTGWAQIHGRNELDWDQQLRMDVWYVDNRSFRLDLLILVRTLVKVFRREGITEAGVATRQKFRGAPDG